MTTGYHPVSPGADPAPASAPCGSCPGCRVITAARELASALDELRRSRVGGTFEVAARALTAGLGPDGCQNVRRLLALEELDA